ncbi:MAG: crossover junction endodeoxyribonuclease RuvC [Candidatus Yanofskybacteria bacterium]|nr:crossover junction endodeoxyribonuclease RuvC [Candidatus Yanofskybacteria bacterium]
MRFLGIDPGTTRIGYGVIEDSGAVLTPLAWGVLTTPGKDGQADKVSVAQQCLELLNTWKPDAVGIERLFFLNNKKSAMPVSEMRGVLMLTLAQRALPIYEFTPLQVKQQVCGHGGAKKDQVQHMVRMILRISETIRPDDAADALAIALCSSAAHRAPR